MVVLRSGNETTTGTCSSMASRRNSALHGTTEKRDIENLPMTGTSPTTKKRGTTEKRDNKKKGKRVKRVTLVKYGEWNAFDMFMIMDFKLRYYKTHPRPNFLVMGPDQVETALNEGLAEGCKEWGNMSDNKKAEWMEKFEKLQAEGKSLMSLKREYRNLY
ncbi:hypothetical protein POM88_004082 [Heracleum sosnowskyi]|uniref:Uncharacterized protein n=1 Tax=Heracleum sosnowskyi TaxID=360622 RepID=A0AAD8NCZ1_9APIA|nr:hypothetical protein POM88_004082 [Heracleum sosnowskyi]